MARGLLLGLCDLELTFMQVSLGTTIPLLHARLKARETALAGTADVYALAACRRRRWWDDPEHARTKVHFTANTSLLSA